MQISDTFYLANEKFAIQRCTTKEWKEILLKGMDTIVAHGYVRQLVGKNIGCGVIQITMEPLK